MKHTPTPWRIGKHGTVVADSAEGISVSGADETQYYDGYLIGESISSNNAERILACVNACEGITNEQLKKLPEMLDDGTAALDACVRLEFYMKELIRFALNDFIPGYGERSNDYTTAFNDAVEEIRKRDPEYDPFKQDKGVRSNQEATTQFLKNLEGGGE